MNWTALSSASASHLRRSEVTISGSLSRCSDSDLQISSDNLRYASTIFATASESATLRACARAYDQYCPIAHALDLVGERWALLVVRELMRGPKRYTDLAETLGIGTNILAARLRDLEAGGIVDEADAAAAGRLPRLRAHRLRPRAEVGHPRAGGLGRAVTRSADRRRRALPGLARERRSTRCSPRSRRPAGSSSASVTRSPPSSTARPRPVPVDEPDVVVEGDPEGIYHLFVDRRLDLVSVQGDHDLLRRLLDAAPTPVREPSAV